MFRGRGGPEMAEADGGVVPMMAPGAAPAPAAPQAPAGERGGINTATAEAAGPKVGGGQPLKEVSRIRNTFPEAWIWSDVEIGY